MRSLRARIPASIALGASLALVLCALARPAAAQFYRYVDATGRVHFTDAPIHAGFEPHALKKLGARTVSTAGALSLDVKSWDGTIKRCSRRHSVPPGLVKAVIAAESGFNPGAISRRGAIGLMQLMPGTARELGVDDALDPWQNIDGGTRYLGEMMGRFPGDLDLALAAYNAGPEAVKRHQGVPPYRETRTYVKRVLRLYKRYDADFR